VVVLSVAVREKRRPRPVEIGAHGALAALAARQHGVVSIRQLSGPLGYSESSVSRAVAAGTLHRLHRGVFAVGHTNLSSHGECLAAVLGCGPKALLSHGSAAWLLGLTRYGPKPINVTSPIRRRPRLPLHLHHARHLTTADRALEEGIPTTAVPRTLLDLAAGLRPDQLQRILERAEELELFELPRVEELLDRTWGHHGWGRLRRAIALYRPPPFTRSQLERRFFDAVLASGLPRPATNFVEAGFELDVYWPEYRFAVELDVYATHGTHHAFERDRLRQEDLKLAGIEMTRVTDVRFDREPGAVLARVTRLLEDRRRELRLAA
jgi:putative AbiEi antitoxin of type IV toxin-antitoxin system